jgi:phosphoribosylamine--glycine ligase
MNILVIGSGGREHALVWKLSRSSRTRALFCAPGNAGIAQQAQCVPIAVQDVDRLLAFAVEKSIDLTVVGPELPLTLGLADAFRAKGLKVVGPSREAARVEGSKAFSKEFMKRHGIPTAPFGVFTEPDRAADYIRAQRDPVVVKADGLAAGKGVVVAGDQLEAIRAVDAMMREKAFGPAGGRVVVEQRLEGKEATFLLFTDGKSIAPMVSSQDYKRARDGDKGPNTGGMGAYSPASILTSPVIDRVIRDVVEPALSGLEGECGGYQGVLYVGLMLTDEGPKVLEFNARFGDPEAQVVLPRLETDLVDLFEAMALGRLGEIPVRWDSMATVCVVLASGGYPGKYETGHPITGLEIFGESDGPMVFHAGTEKRNGRVVTSGGRVLGVTARENDPGSARRRAYEEVSRIRFEGMQYRTDIGAVRA